MSAGAGSRCVSRMRGRGQRGVAGMRPTWQETRAPRGASPADGDGEGRLCYRRRAKEAMAASSRGAGDGGLGRPGGAALGVAFGQGLGQSEAVGSLLLRAGDEEGLHWGNGEDDEGGGEARIGAEHGVVSKRDDTGMENDDERGGGGGEEDLGDGGGYGAGGDDKNDGGRGEKRWKGDRWTSHESMVLVSAKKQVEEDSSAPIRGGDAKWKQIAQICSSHSVQRTSFQCRKRWNTLLAAYKKIKEWERKNGSESYWLMGGTDLRAKKLPAGFDDGIWNVMDSFLGGRTGVSPKLLCAADSDTPRADYHTSAAAEAPQPEGVPFLLLNSSKTNREKEPTVRRKRKRNGGGQEQQPLATDVEQKKASTRSEEQRTPGTQEPGLDALDRFSQYMSAIVNRAIDCYDRNSELNRNLRREQGENLVAVLGTLASAVRDLAQQNNKY